MDDDLLTLPDAAREFGRSTYALYRLVQRDLLPAEKRRGVRALVVRRGDVQAALRQKRGPGRPRKPASLSE